MSRPKGVPTGVSIRILTAGSVRAITRSVGGQGGSAVGLSVGVMPGSGTPISHVTIFEAITEDLGTK